MPVLTTGAGTFPAIGGGGGGPANAILDRSGATIVDRAATTIESR